MPLGCTGRQQLPALNEHRRSRRGGGVSRNIDWPALMPEVARRLLGEPPRRPTRERGGETWRYRRKGSLAVHVAAGSWRDHEAGTGGGVLALIEHVERVDRAGAIDWLRQRGLIPPDSRPSARSTGASRPRGAKTPSTRQNARKRDSGGDPKRKRRARLHVWGLLAASQAIPADSNHPARRWIAARNLWPPHSELPTWVRWIPAAALHPQHQGAGALSVPAAPLADWITAAPDWPRRAVTGCHVVNVAADGSPALDGPPDDPKRRGLGKRSHGKLNDAVAVVGWLGRSEPIRAAVGEGLADALKLASIRGEAAIAMLGTASYHHEVTARTLATLDRVTLFPDADEGGRQAARVLADNIGRFGGQVSIVELPDKLDPADL